MGKICHWKLFDKLAGLLCKEWEVCKQLQSLVCRQLYSQRRVQTASFLRKYGCSIRSVHRDPVLSMHELRHSLKIEQRQTKLQKCAEITDAASEVCRGFQSSVSMNATSVLRELRLSMRSVQRISVPMKRLASFSLLRKCSHSGLYVPRNCAHSFCT